jgi:hypothetical protein
MSAGVHEWFSTRIPAHWNARGVEVMSDQDEILVIVDLAPPSAAPGPPSVPVAPISPAGTVPSGAGRSESPFDVRLYREATRDERMALSESAEKAFGRKVSWGVRTGDAVVVFTTASVPVMTRLRLPERMVLDTLIDAGVARSRSEALAWCVRLVGDNEKEWIAELRTAFEAVESTRARGPRSRRADRS